MTITDLKTFARQINAEMNPDDKLTVTLNREATIYIVAHLKDRENSLSQALLDKNISDKKRIRREYELNLVNAALNAITKAKE